MENNPISPENFHRLQAHIDEIASIVNAIFKGKNLPFELMQFRVQEIPEISEKTVKEAWQALLPMEDKTEEERFEIFSGQFATLREDFVNVRRGPCPNGVLRYECDPLTGICIPICR